VTAGALIAIKTGPKTVVGSILHNFYVLEAVEAVAKEIRSARELRNRCKRLTCIGLAGTHSGIVNRNLAEDHGRAAAKHQKDTAEDCFSPLTWLR
jgi:hypothetical protein